MTYTLVSETEANFKEGEVIYPYTDCTGFGRKEIRR